MSLEVKDRFYDALQSCASKVKASEIFFPLGDWNGHIGAEAHGFEEVHGGLAYGTRNEEGERILEFATAYDLIIGNSISRKENRTLSHTTQVVIKPRLITFCIVEVSETLSLTSRLSHTRNVLNSITW